MSYEGILCIDKPAGFTSFDVIAKLRGMTRTKRVGHAGTLDPMATGVLPVFFGRAAKAIDFISHDKEYIATFMLGITTDTQDSTGEILTKQSVNVTAEDVWDMCQRFLGKQEQLPPMYSAVRVNGQRLYDLARQGKEIERKPRVIQIYSIQPVSSDETDGLYTIRVMCSKGTYIRTLCHDIGQALGCGAVMTSLRRTAACGYGLSHCVTLKEAQALADKGELEKRLSPVESAFQSYARMRLTAAQSGRFQNGVPLWLSQFRDVPANGELTTIFDEEGRFLGLARPDYESGCLKMTKLFALGENQ